MFNRLETELNGNNCGAVLFGLSDKSYHIHQHSYVHKCQSNSRVDYYYYGWSAATIYLFPLSVGDLRCLSLGYSHCQNTII